jgi:ABC-type branched-subunit amino acid transport system substrate-binding protein
MTDLPDHVTRSARLSRRALLLLFVFGLGLASAAAIDLPGKYRTVSSTEQAGPGSSSEGDGQVGESEAGGDAGTAAGPAGATKSVVRNEGKAASYKCEAGKNGGATDVGVTGNSIKVSANVVQDGPGASFLSDAIIGIQAVVDQANVKGICGRKILLQHRNDSWDRNRGLSYISNYIHDGTFALMVNPSSEGLDAAVLNGTIQNAGIPVVGSDGMLISQYRHMKGGVDQAQWVWPVAASTVSTMHIIVQHAVDQGAKTFGLVYDSQYKFGVEGAAAYKGAIERLGATLVKSQGLEPGKTSYTTEADQFNGACGDNGSKCDVVAMLLDPSTAITWIKANGTFGGKITAGPQTLFNRSFAVNCVTERKKLGNGKDCNLYVWTGYNPPVGSLATLPDVARYTADVQSRNAQADVENSFTQGAYLGAQMFVKALEKVGPNLTRANLRAVLDSMDYESDLTNTLSWRPGQHFANTAMQAFRVGYTQDKGFTGWQPANTGFIKDKWVGQL